MDSQTRPLTLLDVVVTVSEIADDDGEVTAVLVHMVQTGLIRPVVAR